MTPSSPRTRATLREAGSMSESLPRSGSSVGDVLDELSDLRTGDVRWADGRAFGLVYDGGDSVREVAEAAASLFLHENALNIEAFPSLRRIQSDVVRWTADLFHGDADVAGFLTSGGTESILCAVLAARERAFGERDVRDGNVVLATSAHAAFHKAAHLFGVEIRSIPVASDFTADVDAMAAAVDDRTVLVVGSAPQYPQGVQDDIESLAPLAASVGASCHVDACMGGFVLPFAEELGRPVSPWDFRVDGVTTISADVHKLGYSPKGASVILHRDRDLRRYQTFVFDDWLGGFYASPNLQGSRPGLPMAAAWAVMRHLGVEGYLDLTRSTLNAADAVRSAVAQLDGIRTLGSGLLHLVAIASDPGGSSPIDVFALGDHLKERGWYLDRQAPPESLHATVSAGSAAVIDDFIADLSETATTVGDQMAADRRTEYSTLE